jgi:hypothetical protein
MAVSLKKHKCTHGHYGLLDCPHCIGEWADLMEWQREVDEAEAVARFAVPASEREWEEHLAACGWGEPSGLPATWIEEVARG